jgi:tRNA-splicing endonuclease subunit Sen34
MPDAGDPHRYHSHFVATILADNATLSPLELIAAGRLGTVVKKAPLLCAVDDNDRVRYLSIEWTGAN